MSTLDYEEAVSRMKEGFAVMFNDLEEIEQALKKDLRVSLPVIEHKGDKYNTFREAWIRVARSVHDTAAEKGFWTDGIEGRDRGELFALIHSELAEGLEFLREGNWWSGHIPEYKGIEEELADTIIRVMDYTVAREIDEATIDQAIGVLSYPSVSSPTPKSFSELFDNASSYTFGKPLGKSESINHMHNLVSLASTAKDGSEHYGLGSLVVAILQYSYQHRARVGEAIIAKAAFNKGRAHKHGKEF